MYCSSCGGQVTQNLIYCKRCGVKLSGGAKDMGDKTSELSPNMLVSVMVATFIFGMAAIIALVTAANNGNPFAILALALSFLLMLVLESLFMWLLFRRGKVVKEIEATNQIDEQRGKELYAAPARMLAESVPSVVEQTTHLLEPIPRDQKSKLT